MGDGLPSFPAGLLLRGGAGGAGAGGPQTSKLPQSSVLGRLQAFMPEMRRANEELEGVLAAGGAAAAAADPEMELRAESGAALEDGAEGAADEGAAASAAAGAEQGGEGRTIFDSAAATASSPAVEMDVALGVWDSKETEAEAVGKIEAGGAGKEDDTGLVPTVDGEPRLLLPGQPKPGQPKPTIMEVVTDSSEDDMD